MDIDRIAFEEVLQEMISSRRVRVYEIIRRLYLLYRAEKQGDDLSRLDHLISTVVTGKDGDMSIFWNKDEVSKLTPEELSDVQQFIEDGSEVHQIEPGAWELHMQSVIEEVKKDKE